MVTLPTRPTEGKGCWGPWAEQLACWAMSRLVNRKDVWGGYRGPEDRQRLGKTCTRPPVKSRGEVFLTEDVLVRHFSASSPGDVVGLHTTSQTNTSLWGALEVDQHADADSGRAAANESAALSWYGRLVVKGFRPLLTDSNGAGGYHLLFLLREPAPTAHVFAFLRELTDDYSGQGLTARPETFPKQAGVAPPGQPGQYGNWLRLPGRHHTREHWSRVWDSSSLGGRWLTGEEAVLALLAHDGDPPRLIPAVMAPSVRAFDSHPRVPPGAAAAGGGLDRNIEAYMAKLPNLAEGQGRDDVAYHFAAFLVRDLSLSDAVALDWLGRWDAGNNPPKGDQRLAEIVADAHKYGRRPYGCGLPEKEYVRHG